jgi:hypothetical protein
MKTSIFLLPGGPKFLPERFSTEFSIWRWKMVGVFEDDYDIFFTMKTFVSWRTRYWSTVLVLAVPGPPMKSTERSCWIERPIVAGRVDGRDEQRGKRAADREARRHLPLGDQRDPMDPVAGRVVDLELVDGVVRLAGVRHHLRESAQALVNLCAVLVLEDASDRPAERVEEVALHLRQVELRVLLARIEEELVQDGAHRGEQHDGRIVHARGALEQEQLEDGRHDLVEELREQLVLRLRALDLLQPGHIVRLPAEVRERHVDDARAAHGRGRGVAQVLDLEVEGAVGPEHRDAVIVGEGEDPVIVHDGVHVLDPDGVDGAVEDQPRKVLLVLIRLTPERGEDPFGPFVGYHV